MENTTKSITVDWTVTGLRKFFEGDGAVKRQVESPIIDSLWRVRIWLHPDHADHAGVFLVPVLQPSEEGQERVRLEKTVYLFKILTTDGTELCKQYSRERNGWTQCDLPGSGSYFVATISAVYCDAVKAKDCFVVRVTIARHPYSSTCVTSTTLSYHSSAASILTSFFEEEGVSDVVLSFEFNGVRSFRRALGQQIILQERSSYFRTMFTSGFMESTTSFSNPSSVNSAASSPWDNDDDSLEWLPSTWLEKNHPTSQQSTSAAVSVDSDMEAVSGSDKIEGEAEQPLDGKRRRIEVKVTDAGYTTYRAMLYYLYSNEIAFTPPASEFVVHLIKSAAPLTRTVDGDGSPPIEPAKFVSCREFLLEKSSTKSIGAKKVEPASPHAVYQLADKLDLEELKELAKEAISKGFNVENILYELVFTFAYHHDEIQTAALEFALKNWDAVKTTSAFTRVVHGSGEIEGATAIWEKLLRRLKADGAE